MSVAGSIVLALVIWVVVAVVVAFALGAAVRRNEVASAVHRDRETRLRGHSGQDVRGLLEDHGRSLPPPRRSPEADGAELGRPRSTRSAGGTG